MELLRAAHFNEWESLEESNTPLEPLELSNMEKLVVIARMKKLAKDPAIKFPNALALVHASYQEQDWERQSTVGDLVRPVPSDRAAWKQYEEFIQLSVSLLSKYRGAKGDWRTDRFAAIRTNDRSSMGSMMAAKVSESVIAKWQSAESLDMVADLVTENVDLSGIDSIYPTRADAIFNITEWCEAKGHLVAEYVVDDVTTLEILDPLTADTIDVVTIQSN